MTLNKTTKEHAFETCNFMPDDFFPPVLDTLQMAWDILHDNWVTTDKGELIEKHWIVATQSYRELWLLAPVFASLTIIVDNNIDISIADNRLASTRSASRMLYAVCLIMALRLINSKPSLSPHYSTASGAQIGAQPLVKDDWLPVKSISILEYLPHSCVGH